MRALVTGATGFLGGRLVRRLVEDGHDVTALVRTTSDVSGIERLDVRLVDGDVRRADSLRRAMGPVDIVFHAAAVVDVIKPNRGRIMSVNVDGTRNVLDAARECGVGRVVHFSSIAALKAPEAGVGDETSEMNGRYPSLYSESKHRADVIAGHYAKQGLDVVRVNPSIVVGHGDPKTGRVIRAFLKGRIRVLPRSQGVASYVHVEDAIDGVLLAASRGRSGERYILTQVNWSHEEMFAHLAEAAGRVAAARRVPMWLAYGAATAEEARARVLGRHARVSRQALRSLDRNHAFSSRKARQELGWMPEDFEKRLKTTVAKYRSEIDEAS